MSDPTPAWADVPAGTKAEFTLPVTHRADGSAVGLPVIAVKGSSPGKTLVVFAGVHGDEFEGIRAVQQFSKQLDLQSLRGTFVAVPLANPPAFEAGSRVNADDRQDMARVFPGNPTGTITEQLACALTQRFIRHADLFCDLHSAGQYYTMTSLCGYALNPEPLLTTQREAAKAFGLPLIWGTPPLPGRSLSAAAEHGVPAIYAETRGEGGYWHRDVVLYERGLDGLAAYLDMGKPAPPLRSPEIFVIEDASEKAGFLQEQMRSPVGGFFQSNVSVGAVVQKDQEIGEVLDPFGKSRHKAVAPFGGLLVFLRKYPPVRVGDPLAYVLPLEDGSLNL